MNAQNHNDKIKVTAHCGCCSLPEKRGGWLHFVLLGLLACVLAPGAYALQLGPTQQSLNILSGVSVHIIKEPLDISSVVQLPDGAWSPVVGEINAGYTDTAHWYRFMLRNASPKAVKQLLEVGYPQLDHVDVYLVQGDKVVASWLVGDTNPFSQRPLASTNFVFPLPLSANSNYTVYIRIQTEGALRAPLTLWEQQAFIRHSESLLAGHAIYYGMLLIMALYNLFIFLILRERAYLYFTFYLVSLVLFMTSLQGTGFRYLYPDSPWLTAKMMLLTVSFTELFMCLFTIRFLFLRQKSPFWNRIFKGFGALVVLCIIGAFSLPYHLVTASSVALALPIMLSCLIVGLLLWARGERAARYYTLAWVVLLVAFFGMALSWMGVLSTDISIEHLAIIGSVLQVLLFSFALADRFNYERDARLEAQEASYRALSRQYEVEGKLLQAVSHDKITGMPSRILLEESLAAHLANTANGRHVMLVLVHLRQLDVINKTLGYENTDQLLRQISDRLEQLVSAAGNAIAIETRDDGSVVYSSHLDGSTFAYIVETDAGYRQQTVKEVNTLCRFLSRPIKFNELPLDINFLVGCSISDHEMVVDPQTMLREAFIAFDRARHEAGGVAVYSPQMNPYDASQLSLMAELQEAIEEDRLELYFQPQIHVASGTVGGFEALVRWNHPERGFVPPDKFIPLAERTRLIHPLTDWVIKRAARFFAKLDELGCDASISVNVSANNLKEREFCSRLGKFLAESRLEPGRFMLEITETAALINPEKALGILHEIRDVGVRLSIDDFGTGYSSLAYIRQMPAHEIKIDNAFIREMDKNRSDSTIVQATIDMCHSLGFDVVAEGVENQAIQEMLTTMGCDLLQGYHIKRPCNAEDMIAWLQQTDWGLRRNPPDA